jgi:hypothetical protein
VRGGDAGVVHGDFGDDGDVRGGAAAKSGEELGEPGGIEYGENRC